MVGSGLRALMKYDKDLQYIETVNNIQNIEEHVNFLIKETKKSDDLPDHIKDVDGEILNEVIECKSCKKGFKIIKSELEFLRNMSFPLPRECPFCRIQEKFNLWVKHFKLYKRICSQCGTEFETHYPPEEVKDILCKRGWP